MSLVLQKEAEAKYPFNSKEHGTDYKAWAKRLVYRYQMGDRNLLHIQISMSHQALEIEIPEQKGA